tara:strand:+ start:174 stop:1007 length:834 start_codon:yes stop_codon:yes gene_type:complete
MKLRIIPRLEIKGNNLVKGINFDGLKIIGDPCEAAYNYFKDGADEIFYDDIVASLYEKKISKSIVKNTSKNISIPLTVAGGIRSLNDIEELLKSGADKVAINTAAIKNNNLLKDASKQFGSQCIILSIHTKKINNKYEIFTENGRERINLEINDWIKESTDLGIGEIFVSSIENEGLCKGLNKELADYIKETNLPLVFGGGVGNKTHCSDFLKTINNSVDGLFMSSALHYKYYNNKNMNEYEKLNNSELTELKPFYIRDLKNHLYKNKLEVRLDENV